MVDKGIDNAFVWVDSVYNNLYLSIHTKKGSQFWNEGFGSELHTIKKSSGDSANRARDMIVESTKWMTDEEIVQEIDVFVEVDSKDSGRFNITVTVKRLDEASKPYELWFDIV